MHRTQRVLGGVLLTILILTGCGDGALVGPGPESDPEPGPAVVLRDAARLSLMIKDVDERIVPSLPEDPAREVLGASIKHLFVALERGFVEPVRDALAGADSAAVRYSDRLGASIGDADFAAMILALDLVSHAVAESGK